jgi:membrane-associated phospholipid phosphatase
MGYVMAMCSAILSLTSKGHYSVDVLVGWLVAWALTTRLDILDHPLLS